MKRHFLLVAVILAFMVCTAACTDEGTSGPAPEARSAALPGQVMVVVGDVTGEGIPRGTIDTITFKVTLVPGEKSVNMEEVSIVCADAVRTETLEPVPGFRGTPPQGSWGIIEVKNEEGGVNNRLEYDEQFVIRINPKAPLVPRQFITIVFTPPQGTPLTIRRVAPPAVLAENNILASP